MIGYLQEAEAMKHPSTIIRLIMQIRFLLMCQISRGYSCQRRVEDKQHQYSRRSKLSCKYIDSVFSVCHIFKNSTTCKSKSIHQNGLYQNFINKCKTAFFMNKGSNLSLLRTFCPISFILNILIGVANTMSGRTQCFRASTCGTNRTTWRIRRNTADRSMI